MFINIFDFQMLLADYKSPHKTHCGQHKPLQLDKYLKYYRLFCSL